MPTRAVVIGIVIFWLATLGWMFQREIWPRFQAGEAPPLQFDLEDEVGGRVILWEVYQGEEVVGTAQTKVSLRPDRSFELRNDILFSKMAIKGMNLKKSVDAYRVDTKGQLRFMMAELKADIQGVSVEIKVKGKVSDGLLKVKLFVTGLPIQLPTFEPEPIDLKDMGNLVSVLHPQNRIPGLFAGKSWRVPVIGVRDTADLLAGKLTTKELLATVSADDLGMPGANIPCWRVDVFEMGKDRPVSRIWVRRSDDQVLQHEAEYEGVSLILKRVQAK